MNPSLASELSLRDFLFSFGKFVLGVLNRRPRSAAGKAGFLVCFNIAWLLLAFCPSPLGNWRDVWPLDGVHPFDGRPPMAGGFLLLWKGLSSHAAWFCVQGAAVFFFHGFLAFLMAKVVCHRIPARRKVVVPRTRRDRARHRIRVRRARPARQARRERRGERRRAPARRPAVAA